MHGIQGQQLAKILLSLLNEKANKIFSRLDIDTSRSYDSVKTEILRFFSSESEGLSTKISNDETLR